MKGFWERGLRWATRRYGAKVYDVWREKADELALLAFAKAVKDLGPHCRMHHPFYLRGPEYIHIGSDFFAGPGLRIEGWDCFEGEAFTPMIVIGDLVGMSSNVHIGAIGRIEIHDHVLIGSNVLITDHAHGSLKPQEWEMPPSKRPLMSKGPIVIEENVWIGEGACILAGVHIGRSAVIGANAVVTHDVAPGTIVGGVPARLIARPSRESLDSVAVNESEQD